MKRLIKSVLVFSVLSVFMAGCQSFIPTFTDTNNVKGLPQEAQQAN